jgi:hypothetical protein
VKRTITGRTATGSMTLGDLRQFVASLDGLPDEASVKARVSFRKHLRSLTVEEDDVGFRDYIKAVGDTEAAGKAPETRKSRDVRQVKQTTSS